MECLRRIRVEFIACPCPKSRKRLRNNDSTRSRATVRYRDCPLLGYVMGARTVIRRNGEAGPHRPNRCDLGEVVEQCTTFHAECQQKY